MELIDVVAAVMLDGSRVLACRRHADRSAGGLWEFPGGKVEVAEDPVQALKREILEELGVGIQVGQLVDRSVTPVSGRLVRLACYLASPLGPGPAGSTDHDVVTWLDRNRLGWLTWAGPDWPTVWKLTGGRWPT